LAVSRILKNKPFKLKQSFEDLTNTDKHKFLKRIATLVSKHPEIDLDVFFQAPYKLYPDVAYFGLDYFSSMRAIKTYTIYKKQQFLQNPDSQLEEIKKSLRFIAKFCIEKKIQLYQYSTHKTADLFTWMKHYKENDINIYTMFSFSNILSSTKELAEDVQKLFVSDFVENFQQLYMNFHNSTKVKPYLEKAYPVTSKFVENEVAKQQKQCKLSNV